MGGNVCACVRQNRVTEDLKSSVVFTSYVDLNRSDMQPRIETGALAKLLRRMGAIVEEIQQLLLFLGGSNVGNLKELAAIV